MRRPLQIGLIGAGRIGLVHAENLTHRIPRARLVSVADVDVARGRACAARSGAADVWKDHRDMLERSAVDAVVIASSTDTHAQMIIDAAQAGKHVFCEKPIAFDLKLIDRVLDVAECAGIKLQIGFNRRFDAAYRRIREAIEQGDVGEPHLIHLISRDPSPPPIEYVRRSGGMFLDMTIHDFDMMRFLLKAEVEEVYAAATVRVDPEIGAFGDVDTAVVTLKFDNGVIGTIDNSRQAIYGYDQRAEVFGSRGRVRTDDGESSKPLLAEEQDLQNDRSTPFFIVRYAESYVEELRAFVDSVVDDRPPPVTGYDGRAPVVMGLAARRSYEENRPVRLSEVDRS